MSQSEMKAVRSSALLQHEKSNVIALIGATTKRHTVVCPLVMERVIAYLQSFNPAAAALRSRD
jgi:hypothetical protein